MKYLLPVMAICAVPLAAHGASTFSDGTFNPSNWGFETIGSGTVTFGQIAAGGNPGQYRQIDQVVNQNTGWFYSFSRYGTTMPTRYEPAVSGAIASVDFSIDSRTISVLSGQVPGIGLGIKQGSLVFMQTAFFNGFANTWTTYSVNSLTPASFSCINGAGSLDFSASGAPIRFGFITANASFSATTTGSVSDYDNFFVNVVQVPAPGALALLGLSVPCLLRRRARV